VPEGLPEVLLVERNYHVVHVAVEVLVHLHYWGESAGAEAADLYECELAVVASVLPRSELQGLLEGVGEVVTALDVAGGAAADRDGVYAPRPEPELVEEGGDTVDVAQGSPIDSETLSSASRGRYPTLV
jgi:hypothetical protein